MFLCFCSHVIVKAKNISLSLLLSFANLYIIHLELGYGLLSLLYMKLDFNTNSRRGAQ